MHHLLFLAISMAILAGMSYGVTLMPLEPAPKQVAHFGLVVGFLAVVSRFYGLL